MARLTPKLKKWISVVAMVILAASTITSPINLKEMLPSWLCNPIFGNIGLVNIAAYVVLIASYWVASLQTE